MDSGGFCAPESRSRALEAVSRARFRRAVIARMLPGMPGDRIQAGTNSRGTTAWPAVRTFSAGRHAAQIEFARDPVRRKNNGRYAGDRLSTKVGTDLRGLIHLFAPCPWKQSLRSSKGTATRDRRARFIVALVEFNSSNGTCFNCSLDGIGRYSR